MEHQGKKIVIAERDNIAAIMEGKKAQEFYVTRGDVLLGDIYLATVENILPSIEAAFVNVGVDRMGFLHAQDVIGKGALKDKLSPKQKIVVQVTKEPTGHKGPRVTMEISLPGRFLVLIPNESGINVSRKIENSKERARLKAIVNLLKPVGVGVIIRTEAEGQSESEIQEDLEVLLEKWSNIINSAESLTPPSLISRDQDLLYRVLREACTDDISEIVVDTTFSLNRVQQLLQTWHMNRNIKITLHKGTEPLLIATDVHKEIKAALQTKVNMPSGGYLFVQTTEALTVIDVNSGKFTSSATQDETILQTNREAVVEIARQLRLRNIGGMIIVDFIDMTSRVDKLAILEEFELALEPDKSKPQIGQLSDLGLVELTRHRQGQSISELFSKKCPHCQGNGYMMEDFKFAIPTDEGELKVKGAKAKLPLPNFKKNYAEQTPIQSVPQGSEQTEETQNTNVQPLDIRNRNKNRRNKFNKNKPRDRQPIEPIETLKVQEPQEVQKAQGVQEIQVAQEIQKPQGVQVAQEVKKPQEIQAIKRTREIRFQPVVEQLPKIEPVLAPLPKIEPVAEKIKTVKTESVKSLTVKPEITKSEIVKPEAEAVKSEEKPKRRVRKPVKTAKKTEVKNEETVPVS